MQPVQIRQGDVFLIPINTQPTGKKVKPEGGRIILARGESTGHHHSLDAQNAALFAGVGYAAVLVVSEDRLPTYPKAMMVKCSLCGNKPVTLGQAILAGAVGELLIHQEHTADVVFPGIYQVIRQREYTPTEIVRVQD